MHALLNYYVIYLQYCASVHSLNIRVFILSFSLWPVYELLLTHWFLQEYPVSGDGKRRIAGSFFYFDKSLWVGHYLFFDAARQIFVRQAYSG